MKIISQHKDYYDICMSSIGIDENIVFIRNNNNIKESNLNKIELFKHGQSFYSKRNDTYSFDILGICGKLYPILKLRKYMSNDIEYIYNVDEMRTYFNTRYSGYWLKMHNFDNYIAQLTNNNLLEYFQKYKCSTFIISLEQDKTYSSNRQEINIEIEPILKNIEYYKIVDAYTIFQEISMFVSEQLNTENDNSPLTDKQKVVAKGFDPKYGFRKRKI